MSYRLRMSAEIGDWLSDLCASEPATAAEVAAALVALVSDDQLSSLRLVGEPQVDPPDPRELADKAYAALLEQLQEIRRDVAAAGTDRKHWADRVEAAEDIGQPDEVQAQLRRQRADAEQREHELTKRSQRMQSDVDAFRTARETAKAMYTAAEASLRIRTAVEAATGLADATTDNANNSESADSMDDLAQLNAALAASEAHLHAVAAQAAQTLRELHDAHGQQAPGPDFHPHASAGPVAGLLELRADPVGSDIRILLALEPAGTVTVLAVLDGVEAVAEHRSEAIELAGELLTDIRAGNWPPHEAGGPGDYEITFGDPAAFLARFLPADASAVANRAAALAATRSIADLRRSAGLDPADLAAKAGIPQERLRFVEDDGLRMAEVHEAVACVRALGGRLELIADFGPAGRTSLS